MENRPHFKPNAVKYTKGYGIRLVISKIIKLLSILLAIAIIASVMYIYIKQPVRNVTGDGYVYAVPQSKLLSPGVEVVIVETEGYNMFTPIIRAIKPQVIYNARIVAGPYGKIISTSVDNVYNVNHGQSNEIVHLEKLNQEYLEKEYVVRAIDNYGQFSEKDVIVSKKEILGVAIKK